MTKKSIDSPTAIADPQLARAEVERLNSQEMSLGIAYQQKAAELLAVRSERGDEVLAAADPAAAARDSGRRVTGLLEELEALADASKRARERRLEAIPAVFALEADEQERQAEEVELEAARLEAESIRLREVLERHDDWGYFPAEGKVEGRYFPAVLHGAGEFRVVDGRGPIFKRKLDAAKALRREAATHRLKTAHQAGMIEADTLEELFAAVHSDALRVGPMVDSIVAWAEKATEHERRRRQRLVSTADGFVLASAPMRLHLEWRNGAIDTSGSRILNPAAFDQITVMPEEIELSDDRVESAALRP